MEQKFFKLRLISTDTNVPIVAQFVADMVKPLGFSDRRALLNRILALG